MANDINYVISIMKISRFDVLSGTLEKEMMPKGWQIENAIPDFGFNIFNRMGMLYTPFLDKNVKELPKWPNEKKFAVCLTHDVDQVSKFELRSRWNAISLALKSLQKTGNTRILVANF